MREWIPRLHLFSFHIIIFFNGYLLHLQLLVEGISHQRLSSFSKFWLFFFFWASIKLNDKWKRHFSRFKILLEKKASMLVWSFEIKFHLIWKEKIRTMMFKKFLDYGLIQWLKLVNWIMYRSDVRGGLRNLHKDDVKLLQESWTIIHGNVQKIGVDIFAMIFKQCPETKFVWFLTICNFFFFAIN